MKLLITGSAGFIGTHAVAAAKTRGWDVIECDLRCPYNWMRMSNEDCRDTEWPRGCTHVLHLAGYSSNAGFADYMWRNYNNNVCGLSHILNMATIARARVVYASSSAVYGAAWPFPCHPAVADLVSHYGKSKRINEMMAESYRDIGLSVLGLRLFNAYGAGDELKPAGRQAPPTWMAAAKHEGKPAIIYGDGRQAKDFIHVSDAVEIIMRLIESDATGIVNVGTGVATSFNDLARLIGCEVEYKPVPDPASYQYFTRADTTRLLSIIGPYKFKSIEEGLACQQIGYTLDRIVEEAIEDEAIEDGQIPMWATRESEAVRNARIVREAVAEGSYCPACKVPWSDCDCEDDLCGVQHRIESDEI